MGQGRGTKTEKDEEKEEEEAAEDPCDQQLEFQQSQLVIMEAHQFQFIGRLLGFPVACRDSYAQCTLCRFVEISQVQLSNRLLTCSFFQRHVPMAIQTVQFLDKDADVPSVVHDRRDASDSVPRQSWRTWRSMHSACFGGGADTGSCTPRCHATNQSQRLSVHVGVAASGQTHVCSIVSTTTTIIQSGKAPF